MAFKNPFNVDRIADKDGKPTAEFQAWIAILCRSVAVANAPTLPALATFPYEYPIPKLTALGTDGSITIDYQGVVLAFTPPT